MSYLPDWLGDAATVASLIEWTTGVTLPSIVVGALTAFRLPNHPAKDHQPVMVGNSPATEGSFERVTLAGELRDWLFNRVMQPNRSIPDHFGAVLLSVMLLTFTIFLGIQMNDSLSSPMFPDLERLFRFVQSVLVVVFMVATYCTSLRLAWRIRYENYRRGFRR